jgi:hypothetical protein
VNPDRVLPEPSDPELGDVSRGLSWLFLLGFLLLLGAARGVYSAQGLAPSARFEALGVLGFVTFVWYWIKQECQPHGVAFPIDLALFMSLLWFFLVPYYLWRGQRWRGLAKFAVLLAGYLLSYLATLAVHYTLVWLG